MRRARASFACARANFVVLIAMAVLTTAVLATTVTTTPAVSASADGAVPRAERVRIAFPADDGSLTPYTFRLGYPMMTLIYDTLLWRDERGTPQPWLARSVGTSDGGRTVRIRLRDGVRWHDGRPLTARDVAFTFDYFARRRHPRFTPQLEAVRAVTATGRLTVVIRLVHRSPGFADQPLADLPILPRHLWRRLPAGATAPRGPAVGSGPYRLVGYERGKAYRFAANQGYFRGSPLVERVDVRFIGGFDATLRALEARRIDMVPLTLAKAAQVRVERPGFRTLFGPTYTGTTLVFNLRGPPFDEPQARRAVADALDLSRIVRSGTAGGTSDVPAGRGYLHPDSAWASPDVIHRPQIARARLAFARLNLAPIDVLAPANDPVRREAGRQVVLALVRAGARARLRALSPARLARAVGRGGAAPRFQAAIGSSPALASHDPDFLRVVFGSRAAALNDSGYRSAEFDRLAARAAAAPGLDERRRLVRSVLDLLARDVPEVPLYFRQGAFVFRPLVYDGWTFIRGAGIFDKRSFLPRPVTAGPRATGEPAPAAEATDSGLGVPGILALVLLAGVLLVIIVGVAGRRRRG